MPTLTVHSANEVPRPSRSSKSVREAQAQYDSYIQSIGGDVGELQLSPGENARSVKVRLRRAGTRLAKDLLIWDNGRSVYFKVETKRGRPRKAA